MSKQFKIFLDKSNQVELFEYDYSQKKSYIQILNEAFDKDLRQIIFTTSLYKKLIRDAYKQGQFVLEIRFMDSIENCDFTHITELLKEVNRAENNETLVNLLLKEIVNDESVDIKSIVVLDPDNKSKFEIYSNGVILCDENTKLKVKEKILEPLFEKTK